MRIKGWLGLYPGIRIHEGVTIVRLPGAAALADLRQDPALAPLLGEPVALDGVFVRLSPEHTARLRALLLARGLLAEDGGGVR